jgi:hypothetical protein
MGALENFFTRVRSGGGNGQAAATLEQDVEAEQPAQQTGTEWGLSPEHLTAAYDAYEIYVGERARELDYRGNFYYCRQHDQKPFDMNGQALSQAPGPRPFPGSQGFLATSGDPRFVPLAMRRPNAPYRLSRIIVKAFTGMLLGQNRWPQIRSDDPDTQAFCEAVIKAANVRNRFTRARNIAGACGTAGLSWLFRNGRPVVRVHVGRFIHVLEWEDPDELVPRHVTELYRTFATRATKDGPQRYEVWARRDWTPVADIVFKPVEVTPQNPIEWVIDEDRSYPHGDEECHFVWLTNQPDDEDPSAIDGQPDYAETYEQLDTIDCSNSVFVQGVARNLDPTLHVARENPEDIKVIRKGSDNAIVTGPNGKVIYVTIPGDVVETGEKLVSQQRTQILETAQCVVTDPDKAAAAGTSSLTMKLVYAPMIGATDLLREPFGAGLVRLLEQMQRSAARAMGPREGDAPADEELEQSPEGSEQFEHGELPPEEQEPERVNFYLELPPRVVLDPILDAEGKPTGENNKQIVEQHPGNGKIELEWGDYFPPTSDDKQKTLTTLAQSTPGKSIVSQRTAVETAAATLNKDATEEWQRVTDEQQRMRLDIPDAGGGDFIEDTPEPVPPGGKTTPAPPPLEEPADIQKTALNGAQVASLVEVVVQVAKGELPRASGVEILAVSLNISREEAEQIIGTAGVEE